MEKVRRLFRRKLDCSYCQQLYEGGVRILAAQLIQGTLAGCSACLLLYQGAQPEDLLDPRIELVDARFFGDSSVQFTFDPRSEDVSRHLREEEGFHKGRWFGGHSDAPSPLYSPVARLVEVFRLRDCPAGWPAIRPARQISATANAPECFELIKSWVYECDEKHRRCKDDRLAVLPDRVISVGKSGDPRLVEPKPGTQADYIALSHRWGGKVALTLTRATYDSFKRCIPFPSFPRTFQDAIIVCRALDVEYLWIDSICIIQLDKEDWDVQGAKMDSVYSNCWLTIAADGAENGEAGFLSTAARKDFLAKTREITYRSPQHQGHQAFVRPLREFGSTGGFGRHYDSWEREDKQSPAIVEQGSYLIKRGWVLQETLLPRRIVHFLPDEVAFRCISASRCECKLEPHERVVHAPLDLEEPREISIRDLKEYWKEIVEQFTRRDLSFGTDRLAAMAGVASPAHTTKPEVHYHAGLWSDELPSTLLWTVDRPVQAQQAAGRPSRRIQPFIAPTWSWASVTGNVLFLFWKRNFDRGRWARNAPDMAIISVDCKPEGKNKYGSVNEAKLTAEGYLCKAHVWLTGGSAWHFPFKMEGKKPDGTLGRSHGLFYPDTDEFLEEMQEKRKEGVSLMVVSVYESRMFLVLKQLREGELVFERTGVLYCETQDAIDLAEWGRRKRIILV